MSREARSWSEPTDPRVNTPGFALQLVQKQAEESKSLAVISPSVSDLSYSDDTLISIQTLWLFADVSQLS